jgi:hypothetical protein
MTNPSIVRTRLDGNPDKRYGSRIRFQPEKWTSTTCPTCHNPTTKLTCQVAKSGKIFCSRECQYAARRSHFVLGNEPRSTTTRDFDRGWISGFCDAEGSVEVTTSPRPACRLVIANTDKSLIDACVRKMDSLGIRSTVRFVKHKNRAWKDAWLVGVGQQSSVLTFHHLVGFRIRRKQQALKNSICSITGSVPTQRRSGIGSDFMRGWLTGFFEGDGSCSTKLTGRITTRRVTILATDRDAIFLYRKWLRKFGVESNWREERGRYSHWKRQFSVRINRAGDQIRFAQTIQAESPRRRSQITRMLQLITAQRMSPGKITKQSVLPIYESEVLSMRTSGATMYQIAKRFGVTPQATFLFLKKRKHLIPYIIS